MAIEIIAPLSGRVILVNIENGMAVEEDAEILVIEAMKMETPIFAPCDGKVSKVLVTEGDQVEEDDILAVIDAG